MRKWIFCALILALTLTGCSKVSKSEKIVLDWGNAINLHLTGGGIDSNYSFPNKLSEIDPEFTAGLTDVDAWGNKLFYRRLPGDRYNLISMGPDGELGNDDDIVMQNGMLYMASKIYSESPLRK